MWTCFAFTKLSSKSVLSLFIIEKMVIELELKPEHFHLSKVLNLSMMDGNVSWAIRKFLYWEFVVKVKIKTWHISTKSEKSKFSDKFWQI